MSSVDSNYPLLKEQLPSCWNQEERMRSMCAPFRNRSVNPEEWIHKYQFWHELINKWSSYYCMCCFTLSVLNVNLKRHTQKISCLPTVWQELYRNGEIISESDYLKETNDTWTGWIIDVCIKKSTIWALSKIKSYIFEQKFDTSIKYIYLPTVKELAELILSTFDTEKDSILLSISQLTKICKEKSGNSRITEENIKLALIWLKRLKKVVFRNLNYSETQDLLVKISLKGVVEITEIDMGVYKLTQQESMLVKNIEELETQRNEIILKTKSALSNGLKLMAKTFLRKKQELDKCIEKRSASLQNVQKLLATIHDASYDKDTLAAYQAGHCALKKFEDDGLTEDKTKDTIYNLSEILEEFNELHLTMCHPINTDSDTELEKELAEIMKNSNDNIKNTVKINQESCDYLELPDLMELNLRELPVIKKKNSRESTDLLHE